MSTPAAAMLRAWTRHAARTLNASGLDGWAP